MCNLDQLAILINVVPYYRNIVHYRSAAKSQLAPLYIRMSSIGFCLTCLRYFEFGPEVSSSMSVGNASLHAVQYSTVPRCEACNKHVGMQSLKEQP